MKVSPKGKYYGTADTKIHLDEIVLSQYDYNIKTTPWHYHENPYFMFVLDGQMIDQNKKVKTLLPTGSLMFNNWQESHYGDRYTDQAGGFHLEFEKSWLQKNGVDFSVFEGSQLIQDPQIHLPFMRLYHEFAVGDSYSRISTELLLLQICDALGTAKAFHKKSNPAWIIKLKEILTYDTSDFSLQYLSEQLGIHPVHISRAVPKYLSVSLGEYIRQTKTKIQYLFAK